MLAQLTSGLDLHAQALLVRAERTRQIASNIANADTPGYVARDVDFKQAMAAHTGSGRTALAGPAGADGTHPAHIPLSQSRMSGTLGGGAKAYTVQTQAALDNNTVDLDRERANFVDNAIRYETTLRFINGHSKTILSAIQGQ